MNLEQTIQMCFDKHAPSVGTRKEVLIHLFCSPGSGFEWVNGELVNTVEKWTKFDGRLDENGKAVQHLSLKEVALRLVYDSTPEEETEDITYEEFLKKMNEVEEVLKEQGLGTLEELALQEPISKVNLLRGSHEKYLSYRLSKEHSPVFNVPTDIKPDWKEGIDETMEILKELNLL